MRPVTPAVRQMRNVVLIVGLAWTCVGVPLLIGVASVGGAAWFATAVWLTLAGSALAIGGAIGTWFVQAWGPIAHVAGALLVVVKSIIFAQGDVVLTGLVGYFLVLAVFLAVVVPNWPVFRSHHA